MGDPLAREAGHVREEGDDSGVVSPVVTLSSAVVTPSVPIEAA